MGVGLVRDHYIKVNSPEAFEICKKVRDMERTRMGLVPKELELPKPPKKKPGRKAFYSDPENLERASELFNQGLDNSEVARHLGISLTTLHRIKRVLKNMEKVR